ncbi:helix-turn-helix transcriptional regulator [Blastococcus xanthinilyticus]|nr:helix-turn-helix domain-containing protein [Blastococcus xanthinilyticus]
MTTAQVAELIQRPIETLRYWRWRGEGPTSFKIGRSVVYERSDVESWLRAQKAATSAGGAPAV